MKAEYDRVKCNVCPKIFKRFKKGRSKQGTSIIGVRPSSCITCSTKCSIKLRNIRDFNLCSCGNKKRMNSKTCRDCYISKDKKVKNDK